jgi:nucleotide-binding universal stress UspA family protein
MSRTSSNLLTTYLGRDKWQAIVDSQKLNAQQVLIGKKKEALMIKEALTAFCDEAKNDHAECQFIMDDVDIAVAEGNVVEEIIARARSGESDVIVMGYHGRSKLEGLVVGSTSQRLLHNSHLPVFLIRLSG